MNLNEAVELLKAVSEIPVKESAKHPEVRIVHAMGGVVAKGYTLRIEKKLADADFRNHLSEIAESKKLAVLESERYLVLYRKSA